MFGRAVVAALLALGFWLLAAAGFRAAHRLETFLATGGRRTTRRSTGPRFVSITSRAVGTTNATPLTEEECRLPGTPGGLLEALGIPLTHPSGSSSTGRGFSSTNGDGGHGPTPLEGAV